MKCDKCGCLMIHYGTNNNFDNKTNEVEQSDLYNCPNCGHDTTCTKLKNSMYKENM